MSDQLLVVEKLIQLLRRGIDSDEGALWGFLDEPLVRRVALGAHRRHLRDSELQELKARIGSRANHRNWKPSRDQSLAENVLGPAMIVPTKFRNTLFGHVDYTEEELEVLATIPWTAEELSAERGKGWETVLFPGHPSVTVEFLFDIFGHDSHKKPCFSQHEWWWLRDNDAWELRSQSLELRWYLVRRVCEPKGAQETETHRQVSVVEAVTAALMFQRVIVDSCFYQRTGNDELTSATAECREHPAIMADSEEVADYGVGVGIENGSVRIQRYPGHGAYGPLFTRRLPDGT